MIDNRKVNDNHQQGIARKKMRKGDLVAGQGGKMMGHKAGMERGKEGRSFDRDHDGMTPKKA